MAAIECSHVTKEIGAHRILDDISFRLEGGVCALIGPNGAGKTTLLKALSGLTAISQGQVRVDGVSPEDGGVGFRRKIGVMPENLGLFGSLTVEEHLLSAGPIYGLSRA